MKFVVLDSESDGLVYSATKIWVLGWTEDGDTAETTHDYDKMREVLSQPDTMLVAHNCIRHDMPLFNKILGLNLTYDKFVDTLALSWYLNFDRTKHGLEWYGVDYGVPKPKIDDWHNLSLEEYAHRVTEDVKINWRLWSDLLRKLTILYPEESERVRLIKFLGFKMDCARLQEEQKIKLDVAKAQKHYDELLVLQEQKTEELKKAMPKKPIYKTVNEPKNLYKKDGSLSAHGIKWFSALQEAKLPETTKGSFNTLVGYEEGNPSSNDQVKDWLYSLGWEPQTYKFTRNKQTGDEKKVEQVRKDGDLCPSVKNLIEKDPAVAILDGLTVINHRLGFFKGLLDSHKDGYLEAGVEGLTNTFRFKHKKPLANIPGVDKPWGKEIRSCLIAGEGQVLCGSDMVSLEATTRNHYIQPLDPKYVEAMQEPGYDPHLALSVIAGKTTQEDYDFYKTYKEGVDDVDRYHKIHKERKKAKVVSYSAMYGVGAAKLAREMKVSKDEAQELLDAFWKMNWAIKEVASKATIKVTGPFMWIKNPVSGFWHNLRNEKDAWSTINQSTGVYCFDTWMFYCRSLGVKPVGQWHDELLAPVNKGEEQGMTDKLKLAIKKTNDKLKLNVLLDIDVKYGDTYADVH